MTREPIITGEAAGLRCDAPSCGWKDMRITRDEYPEYRNAPCPDCGENILTDADYNTLLRIEKMVAWANKWLWWLTYLPGKKGVREVRIETDGTGRATVEDRGLVA